MFFQLILSGLKLIQNDFVREISRINHKFFGLKEVLLIIIALKNGLTGLESFFPIYTKADYT